MKENDSTAYAFDIQSFFDEFEIYYQSSGKNVSRGWIEINCPFCDDPSTHLGINLDSKLYHCWICGSKGGPEKLVKYILKTSWQRAKEIVKQFTDWTRIEFVEGGSTPKKLKLPTEFFPITPNTIPPLVRQYLSSGRNFVPEEITRKFNLYYPGPIGNYKLRLIIPITVRNRIVNFLGRDLTGKTTTRYKNCPNDNAEIMLNSLLYGIEDVPNGYPLVLVEGVFDQWRLGYGAVATFGTNVTSEQALLLQQKRPSKIFILLDPDMGDEKYQKIASKLWFAETELVNLNFDDDPAKLSPADARSIMKELLDDNFDSQKGASE